MQQTHLARAPALDPAVSLPDAARRPLPAGDLPREPRPTSSMSHRHLETDASRSRVRREAACHRARALGPKPRFNHEGVLRPNHECLGLLSSRATSWCPAGFPGCQRQAPRNHAPTPLPRVMCLPKKGIQASGTFRVFKPFLPPPPPTHPTMTGNPYSPSATTRRCTPPEGREERGRIGSDGRRSGPIRMMGPAEGSPNQGPLRSRESV